MSKKPWIIAAGLMAAIVIPAAACGPTEDADPAQIGTQAPPTSVDERPTSIPAPPPTTRTQATKAATTADLSLADREAVYELYLTSEGIVIPQDEAEEIGYRACMVFRSQDKTVREMPQAALWGVTSQIVKEQPQLTQEQASRLVGAATVVYCDEYSNLWE